MHKITSLRLKVEKRTTMSDHRKSKKAVRAAQTFREGHSQAAYRPRGTITAGLNSPENGQHDESGLCHQCESLLDLRDIFNSFVHTGRDLKRRRQPTSSQEMVRIET